MAKREVKYVENDVVNAERPWVKSGWLQTAKKKGKAGAFVFASQVYETGQGAKITVFFNAETAFLLADNAGTPDEDFWTAKELISVFKKNRPAGFPDDLEEYIPLISPGRVECDMEKLEEYDLTTYKADIEARLNDLRPYGDITLGEAADGIDSEGEEFWG